MSFCLRSFFFHLYTLYGVVRHQLQFNGVNLFSIVVKSTYRADSALAFNTMWHSRIVIVEKKDGWCRDEAVKGLMCLLCLWCKAWCQSIASCNWSGSFPPQGRPGCRFSGQGKNKVAVSRLSPKSSFIPFIPVECFKNLRINFHSSLFYSRISSLLTVIVYGNPHANSSHFAVV